MARNAGLSMLTTCQSTTQHSCACSGGEVFSRSIKAAQLVLVTMDHADSNTAITLHIHKHDSMLGVDGQ